jgi:hypothetical protein
MHADVVASGISGAQKLRRGGTANGGLGRGLERQLNGQPGPIRLADGITAAMIASMIDFSAPYLAS